VSRVAAERKAGRAPGTSDAVGATTMTATSGTPEAAADGGVHGSVDSENPTAAFLMPLLAILAAGMIARALSDGFEFLYPLRLLAAVVALWCYRKSYASVDLRFSWRGPAVGVVIFLVWWAFGSYLTTPQGPPAALELAPPGLKVAWIGCRLIAAVITVPLAEELAYRGYLMRRLVAARFESVPFSATRWPALAMSAVAFGVMHGAFWIPGIIAGFAYGAIVVRTGKLGEAVVAHGTTNALLAVGVLTLGRWQLW
jgi:CAAX prenyl protease-like protein